MKAIIFTGRAVVLLAALVLLSLYLPAQNVTTPAEYTLDPAINRDSLFHTLLQGLPIQLRDQLLAEYNSTDPKVKDFFLFMLHLPRSSKAELITNIDSNYHQIDSLRTKYRKLVPPGYTIRIEFEPEDKVFQTKECVDLMIMQNPEGSIVQDWKLIWHSEKLDSMLKLVHWNYETLTNIKSLLLAAHCISIENGEITTIGYARNGMGMYSYKLFANNLTSKQIQQYNNGSTYIFYKRNIVLEYGGGATGPQSFPD